MKDFKKLCSCVQETGEWNMLKNFIEFYGFEKKVKSKTKKNVTYIYAGGLRVAVYNVNANSLKKKAFDDYKKVVCCVKSQPERCYLSPCAVPAF